MGVYFRIYWAIFRLIMTKQEYERLSIDLQELARIVPLNWGTIQNDRTDRQINMFQIDSFAELERQTANLSEDSKNYFRRRWFLWKCAQCEEYLFYVNENVTPNPNARDQDYDIEFNNDSQLRFDVKGTVIPRDFRNNIDAVLDDPTDMVNFFYEQQSRGVRNKIQNRLFIVHHSFRDQQREMYLRCHWAFKQPVYAEYSARINTQSNFIQFQDVRADVIFIFENIDRTITYQFHSIN